MLVAYYRYASKNCLQTDSDTCRFRYCDKQCQNDKLHYVYKIKDSDHSNKYYKDDSEITDHVHVVTPLAKELIMKNLVANPLTIPISIFNTLKHDLKQDQMPSLKQKQTLKPIIRLKKIKESMKSGKFRT
jgi:hypothetical protein